MRNIKVGIKIGLGFGALIAIAMLLGAMAWISMDNVSKQSFRMDKEIVPQVAVAVEVERSSLLTMYAMRGFAFTGDDQFWTQTKKELEGLKVRLSEARDLAAKYPSLTKLKTDAAIATDKVAEYERFAEQTKALDADLETIVSRMDQSAATYTQSLGEYLAHQRSSFRREYASGVSTNAFDERMLKLEVTEELIIAGGDIRVGNFKSQARRDSKLMRETLKHFERIEQGIAKIKPLDKSSEAIAMMKKVEDSAAAYKTAMESYIKNYEMLEKLNEQRGSTAQAVLDAAKDSSASGVAETQKLADTSTLILSKASTVLLGGLTLALVLGLGIAVVITRAIVKPLSIGVHFADEVAGGNLDGILDVDQKDEIGQLADSLRKMVNNLKARILDANQKSKEAEEQAEKAGKAMIEAEKAQQEATAKTQSMIDAALRLQKVAEATSSASEELSAQIEQSSRGAEQQAQRVAETATAMEEMNATVLEVAKSASNAAETSESARQKAGEGATIVGRAVQSIHEVQKQALELKNDMATLGKQAEGISQIMNVISDIADQTNLLALNAAIEAARAGEAGRGFAVVADEVRKLAEKTMQATQEVGEAIQGIQDGARRNIENVERSVSSIEEATALAKSSGNALNEIVEMVLQSSDQVRSIATASEQQSATSEEINRSVEEVSAISSETSLAMNQAAQAVSDLATQTQELRLLIEEMNEGQSEKRSQRSMHALPA